MSRPLRAGAARVDITPRVPTPMAGYPVIRLFEGGPQDHVGYTGRVGSSDGVHDPLFARALALGDDNTIVVIVALDLCMVTGEFTAAVRAAAATQAGIDGSHLLLAASHTHSAPDLFGHWEPPVPGVLEATRDSLIEAVIAAVDGMQPATAGWGRGHLAEPIVNRRDVARPSDPEVGVLRVEALDGRVLGVAFTYACHPIVVGSANRQFSADFPGYAAALGEAAFGPDAVCLFLNGAAGNVNPCAFPYAPERNVSALARATALAGQPVTFRSHEAARRLGALLGGEVVRTAELVETTPHVPIGARSDTVELPLKTPEDLERYFHHLAVREPVKQRFAGLTQLPVELQAITVGDGGFLGIPGEPFVEIGLALKAAAGVRPIFPIGYANDYPGYLPTEADLAENRYESVATPFGTGAHKRVECAARALLASHGVRTAMVG